MDKLYDVTIKYYSIIFRGFFDGFTIIHLPPIHPALCQADIAIKLLDEVAPDRSQFQNRPVANIF